MLQRPLWLALAVLLVASDVYYLSVTLSVDHSRNHWPRFDFDRSDGIARHDFIAAVEAMRRQVEVDHAGLVIYYPRGQSENSTDPAMFFARFLRHFGRYSHRSDLVFPCHWCSFCSWCSAYGCPFPEVIDQGCGSRCCYRNPLAEIARRPELAGKRMVLWWHDSQNEVEGISLKTTLASFARYYAVTPARIPDAATGWAAYELSPHAERPIGQEGGLQYDRRRIVIGCDDAAEVVVNGQLVGEVGAWQAPATFALPLGTERVVVAVSARNGGGPGGLIGAVIDPGGDPVLRPARWVCSAERQDDWYLPAFDDHAWTEPKVLAPHGSRPWGIVDAALGGADWVWTENPAREQQTIYCRWWIAASSSGSQ